MKRNQQQYDLPLKILSYDELYGWTMDRIVDTVGRKNNCEFVAVDNLGNATFVHTLGLLPGTFCGVFRRQALDRGAAQLGVDHIVTGHNADDIAETVLMNSTSRPLTYVKLSLTSSLSHARRHCSTCTVYGHCHQG